MPLQELFLLPILKTGTVLAPPVTSIISRPRSTSPFGKHNVWCPFKEFLSQNSFNTAVLKGLSC